MNPRKRLRSALCFVLLLSMLVGYMPTGILKARATEITPASTEEPQASVAVEGDILVPTYPTLTDRYVMEVNPYHLVSGNDTTRMGGMTVVNGHIYYIKTTEDGNHFIMAGRNLKSQSKELLTTDINANVGTAKSIASATIGISSPKYYLFLATGNVGTDALLCIHANGSNMTLKSSFDIKTESGTSIPVDAVETLSVSGSNVTLLIRSGVSFYTATIAVPGSSGSLTAKFAFSLDQADTQAKAMKLAADTPVIIGGDYYLLGMAKDDCDRLYLSAQVNCVPVILVFSHLSELVASGSTNVQAELENSISVAAGGYESYTLQDLSVHQGVVYFSSRQRWITSEDYRSSIGNLLNNTDLRSTGEETYRESGTYRIAGTGDQSYVIKTTETTETADNGSTTTNYGLVIEKKANATEKPYYFGFISDNQGYWYIRASISISGARVGDLYITANADGSVTLEPKREGDPNQLWYVRYNRMNENNLELKLYSIQSKATGLFLRNNATDNLKVEMGSEGKTFVLEQVVNKTELEKYLFDPDFYKMAYPKVTDGKTDEQAKQHWLNTGKALGYMGSPYFDPIYYLAHNPDVESRYGENNYDAAYTHFITYGYWEGRQGSLYFSAREYVSNSKNADVYNSYFPLKEEILRHYALYGSLKAAYLEPRNGSDEFSLKQYSEEFNLPFKEGDTELGKELLYEYVASLIRLKNCQTIEEFYDLIFDVEVYKYLNRTDLSPAKLASVNKDTYDEKLLYHWERYGKAEGRTASIIFNPSYYATRYSDKGVTLSNAYEHYFTTGRQEGLVGSEYISMSTEADLLCKHSYTAQRRITSCTTVCSLETFCAKCLKVINRVDSPAMAHKDADNNSTCDLCDKNLTNDILIQSSLLQLELPGLDNEWYGDLSGFANGSTTKPSGTYYMVQKGSDGVYRIFDPLSQSNVGTIAATQVYEVGGRIIGADPDMAVYIDWETATNNTGTNQYTVSMEGGYYLYIGGEPNRIIRANDSGTHNIAVTVQNSNTTIAFNRNYNVRDPENSNNSTNLIKTLQYWLCLEQRDGNEFFEWSSRNNQNEADDVFYLYRPLEDRLHTDGLYTALQRAAEFVPTNAEYDITAYQDFLAKVEEVKALYVQYNGIALSDTELAKKATLQEQLDLKERELLDLIGILEINLQGNTVSYFSASMYNWNEDEMNSRVTAADSDKDKVNAIAKGFYFETANNKGGTTAPFSVYDSDTVEYLDGNKTKSQMYSIYSGIAAKDLYIANNPPFHNTNVIAADYWSAKSIKGAKEVYTDVRVPFVYKDGYYTLDSDKNGVFFEGTPSSGTTLAILEKPVAYYWPNATSHGNGALGYQEETEYSFRPANNYVTGFQPFAQISETSGKSYTSATAAHNVTTPVDSYLLDGVAYKSQATPAIADSGRGTAVWGFGMQLNVNFRMTEDGLLRGDPNKPITFTFSGDDDVWVYIDSKLVMELGGSHDALQGEINFSTGSVTVYSEKYRRIRDKNPNGYGRKAADKNTYGAENITEVGSIITNNMQQPNIYSSVFSTTLAQFSAEGEHTLTIFYMDRGKGRTNCAISFNLPQSDVLIAEKEIAPYYGKEDGTLTQTAISDKTMDHLNTLDFGFTLTENGSPAAYEYYTLYDAKGLQAGRWKTDVKGHFTLKNGYRAEFDTLQFNGQNYQIIEEDPGPRWGKVSWSGVEYDTLLDPIDGYTSQKASVTGDPYEIETISYVCTNTYIYYPELTPEDQVVVMDYGKPIYLSVIDNLVFTGAAELVVRDGTLKSIACTNETDTGYVTLKKDSANRGATLSLKKLLDRNIKIKAVVKVTLDDGTVRDNITVNIQVFPATLMYYETNFLSDPSKVFKTTVKNPASKEYNWTEKTATGKDDLQDSGEIGDEVYKPLIDKEFVPSNAFFVDFDGKGYKDRYSADPVYKGHDFDVNGNWVTHHVADPVENTNGTPLFPYDSAYTIDQKTGVFVLDVKTGYSVTSDWKAKMYGPEFYTTEVSDSLQGNPLEYTYSNEDYFEIRFMSEDCVFDPLETGAANPKVVLRILYRDETNILKEKYLHLDYTFKDGSYQVVTGALPTEVKGLPIISFGVRFQHLRAKDGVEAGKIYVDYLYVGPKTGWAESVNSDYLYFGFENEQGDQLRYGTGVYTGKNYDAQGSDGNNPNWAVSHNNTNCDNVSNLDGTLTVNVAHNPEKAENCGPRLMTTGKNNTFPIGSSNTIVSAAQGLNFDLRNAEYIQIRFKTENCTWSSRDKAHSMYFFFTYINKEGEECISTSEITAKYSLETEEYQYYRIKLTKDHPIIANGKTLTNFGLRFRSIIGKNNTDGKIIIDHLFIGTEEAMYRLDTPEEAMFFDFNNTEADQIRYSSDIYGGYNFDRAENAQWGMSYGGSTQTVSTETRENKNRFEIADGMIRLNITRKPYSDQTRIGTTAFAFDPNDTDNPAGYYPWNTSVKRMPLSFPSNSADYVQIRFKVVDCEPLSDSVSTNIGVVFYHDNSAGSIDYEIANSAKYEITDDFITLTYSTGSKLDISRTVTGLGIIFRNIRCKQGCEDTAAVYLDYLYIGKMAESNPAADSLYIGFDNMAEDRERYASDTYGNINLDSEETTHWVWNSNKVESITIDNNAGTATITALEEMVEYDSDGVVIFPDVYAEVGENGKFFNDPLDFKPQYAEIFQIRFKMTGFRNGDYADAEAENGLRTVNPYIKLFWRLAGEEQADNVILACDTITLNNTKNYTVNDYSVITKGAWVTVTAKIPEEVRNSHSVASIRPYFGALESLGDGVKGEITIDYIYIGPDDRPDQVYGYDSHYNNDTTLSDGHSLFVEGSGVKLSDTTATYTETNFSFKGTGFDIISRTGPKQATIRVEVVGPTVDKEGNPTVDVVKSMTVNTKGELELYQIPVVSVQGLPYGEYTVTLWVNKAVNSNYPFLSRGGEFYFDAVRIYNPMSKDNYSQYKADREAYPRIKELRNILLSADSFGQIVDSESGAVFIDVNSSNVDPDTGNILDPTTGESTPGSTGYLTATVQTYNKQGPKNEIYLAPGQAVAFNLQVSTIAQIMSLDIGAKTITNSAAHMEIGLLAKDAAGNFTISTHGIYTVTSATAQYWEVDITDAQVRSDAEGIYQPMYLVIYNTSPFNSGTDRNTVTNNVLSLTDVKVTYKGNPSDGTPEVDSPTDTEIQKRTATVATEPVEFLVDGNTMTAARYFIDVVAETPMLDGNAKIYHSLNLASDISLNYIVPMTDVANYDSFCLELQIPVYEGNTLVGSRGITLSPVAKGNYWYFTLEGLTAVHMMDEISARLVMESNGRTYYSETDRYSIAQYAMGQLEKSNASAKLKTLCANLLRYGAKAQIFKGYRTDNLADKDLTDAQRALLTDLETVSFGSNSSVVEKLDAPKVNWLGKSLILDSKVTVRYIFEMADPNASVEDVSLRIRYTDLNGSEKEAVITGAQPYGNKAGWYCVDFDGLLAAELRTVLYATAYMGKTPVSNTITYSVDTYGNGRTGALGALCKALMAYSDCANAFFG